jgi:hypothetical protein
MPALQRTPSLCSAKNGRDEKCNSSRCVDKRSRAIWGICICTSYHHKSKVLQPFNWVGIDVLPYRMCRQWASRARLLALPMVWAGRGGSRPRQVL